MRDEFEPDSNVPLMIDGVSVLAGITGGFWIYSGYYRTREGVHATDADEARNAARRYNAKLTKERQARH